MQHIPVMLKEVLEWLEPKPGRAYIDCTLGLGGHTRALIEVAGEDGEFHGIERDPLTFETTQAALSDFKNFTAHHARFSQIPDLIKLTKPLGGILLDLGISSLQLSKSIYGLSFSPESHSEPLDMRLDPWCMLSAADILNHRTESELADLFWELADYPAARPLARAIVQNRPLNTIGDLVKLCDRFRRPNSRLHPSTLPFMALRMAVNDELAEIEKALPKLIEWMEPEARIVVISFHSGEDRIVKKCFKSAEGARRKKSKSAENSTFIRSESGFRVLSPKPLIPGSQEIKVNPRARSAKMRVGEKY
ncbi:MAG: 16S rRNA (cytosine(1402)-N(4))-methyltransferase RsmH [Candidatus Caenarcaniphilales bacterium]|nr:16S rRNA (cytosine(1402)-N(4))-methyltransferase RsmH [Candidatus Caenarcaniphilales bacterium]